MAYGLPYMGGKSGIADKIIDILPAGERFCDLFFGGGAITHCAMMSKKWKRFYASDINGECIELFNNAIDGKYKNETRWISRDDFFRLKDTDPYVRRCWSFGNDGNTYLYGNQIEPYKKACHYAVVFDDWGLFGELCGDVCERVKQCVKGIEGRERRIAFQNAIVERLSELYGNDASKLPDNPLYNSVKTTRDFQLQRLESLESLERLQSLERLERLQSLQRLEKLDLKTASYTDYAYKEGDVVYCDIPYNTEQKYNKKSYIYGFDFDAFYDWARTRAYPVFISEYSMPDDFVCIAEFNKVSSLGANHTVTERVFIHASKVETATFKQQLTFDF